MSKASETAAANFGDVLTSGLASRGGGTQLPSQAAAEVELSPAARLAELEQRIESSLGQYQRNVRQLQLRHRQELGELLETIGSDPELVKAAGYENFSQYVKGRWGWDRSYVYRLMDLAMVRRALAPLGPAVTDDLPESRAREIAPVARYDGDDTAREFWTRVHSDADTGGKKVTAAYVRQRRTELKLGVRPSSVSPIGDTDDEDDGDEEAARRLVNDTLERTAEELERVLNRLDKLVGDGVPPLDADAASRAVNRIKAAGRRLDRTTSVPEASDIVDAELVEE